jgi:hypothetical protein
VVNVADRSADDRPVGRIAQAGLLLLQPDNADFEFL